MDISAGDGEVRRRARRRSEDEERGKGERRMRRGVKETKNDRRRRNEARRGRAGQRQRWRGGGEPNVIDGIKKSMKTMQATGGKERWPEGESLSDSWQHIPEVSVTQSVSIFSHVTFKTQITMWQICRFSQIPLPGPPRGRAVARFHPAAYHFVGILWNLRVGAEKRHLGNRGVCIFMSCVALLRLRIAPSTPRYN